MKIHRFIGNFDLDTNPVVISDTEVIHQMRSVLKLKVGEEIILGNGQCDEVRATLTTIEKNNVVATVTEKYYNENESKLQTRLYLAILKRENFELAVQKAVETGVSEITPIITARTVKTGLNMERLQKIIREAAEQSGRGIIPILHEVKNFSDAVETCNPEESIIFDASGILFVKSQLSHVKSFFIGPEGGFTSEEIQLATANGFHIASLGTLTLRGETAAIVATYLLGQ